MTDTLLVNVLKIRHYKQVQAENTEGWTSGQRAVADLQTYIEGEKRVALI